MEKYIIIRSNRKTVSLQINDNCELIVRAPYTYPKSKIDSFVDKYSEWIKKTVAQKEKVSEKFDQLTDDEILELKKRLSEYLPDKIEYYSRLMCVKPTGWKVTSARKRYGSCSGKNSLCFSYILMLYPKDAIDYVIVHELAHIRHHNHSKDFYKFVEKVMPDYKARQKLLREFD